jgi:hypothetical protein
VCALVLIIARFTIGGSAPSSAPAQSTPVAGPTATPGPSSTPGSSPTPLQVEDSQARAFLQSYLAYLYGKSTLAQVVDVTDSTRQGLPPTLANISLAEQSRAYRIEVEQTTPPDGGSIDGTALIQEGDGLVTYTINFTMSQQNGVWLVDSVPTFTT